MVDYGVVYLGSPVVLNMHFRCRLLKTASWPSSMALWWWWWWCSEREVWCGVEDHGALDEVKVRRGDF